MRAAAYAFVQHIVDQYGPFHNVIEFGHGAVRPLFPFCDSYTDVDLTGDLTLTFDTTTRLPVDCVVCAGCIEHPDTGSKICQAGFDLLRPGGVLIITATIDAARIIEHDIRIWLHDFDLVRIDSHVPGDIYASAIR